MYSFCEKLRFLALRPRMCGYTLQNVHDFLFVYSKNSFCGTNKISTWSFYLHANRRLRIHKQKSSLCFVHSLLHSVFPPPSSYHSILPIPAGPLPLTIHSVPAIFCLSFSQPSILANSLGLGGASILMARSPPAICCFAVGMTTNRAPCWLRATCGLVVATVAGKNAEQTATTARRAYCCPFGTSIFFARGSLAI